MQLRVQPARTRLRPRGIRLARRADIPVRSLSRTRTWLGFVACFRKTRCCGQECPRAAMGVRVSLQPLTRDMASEALSSSFYERKAIQTLTRCTAGTYIEIQVISASTAVCYTIHTGYTPWLHRGATG